MKNFYLPFMLIAVFSANSFASDEARYGRYSIAKLEVDNTQKNPMRVVIDTSIPRSINTVGGALDFLLMRSGYKMADKINASYEVANLYSLSIPEVHRSLGPITLIDALQVVVGEAYVPIIDPVHRLIAFEVDRDLIVMLEDN